MVKQLNINIAYEELDNIDELNPTDKNLLIVARKASEKAYAPYSNFFVGAAVLLENGEITSGANQENAAYPSGLCAERTAIFWTGANFPTKKIEAIAVTAKKGPIGDFIMASPCGACRQALLEYEIKQKENIRVILEGNNGKVLILNAIRDLLPIQFTSEAFL
ncbi:MAG: cytidine deaminase [Flammeovirgaceae bacterium]|nr:cytidine deaminase [Flammeovirgaceae bacterium]